MGGVNLGADEEVALGARVDRIGYLEIARLRAEAERRLGPRFDIRAFHDRVLEDGALPMPALGAKIERWIAGAETRSAVNGQARRPRRLLTAFLRGSTR